MSDSKRRPLLIVEDDLSLQKQMRWAFDKSETVVADDLESAIAQIRRHEPAVVTMDLGLPPYPDDASVGFELLGQILALAPHTKVIVLTGQNDHLGITRMAIPIQQRGGIESDPLISPPISHTMFQHFL